MRQWFVHWAWIICAFACLSAWSQAPTEPNAEPAPPPSLKTISEKLAGAGFKQVPPLLKELEAAGKERVIPLFEAMLAGDLYYRKADRLIVIAQKGEKARYKIHDALNGEALGELNKSKIKKIRVNNNLRGELRSAIARLTLFSQNPQRRKAAAYEILDTRSSEGIQLLHQARATEQNAAVLEVVNLALALHQFDTSTVTAQRLAALDVMEDSLEPAVRNKVQALLLKDETGEYIEKDAILRTKAQSVLNGIQGKTAFYGRLETVFFGLSLGSVLLLVATGLAITFGVMGVINMAHGELIMLGAYTTYVVQLLMPNHIEYSVLVAIPAAFVVSGAVGVAIERGVIQFLQGRPLETLLATFGISLILQQAVRSVFSPLNRQVATPDWMSGSLEFNAIFSITYNRLYVLLFALLVFLVLQLILKKTTLGLQVQAVSQNRNMAKAMGIRTEWVDALTFGLGSGIAGIAGVALSQLTNVGPNLGQAYIIDSFMVVVFGGVGNLWGTLVGGFTLGVANKFLEPLTGTVLANILVLVFIILFIQKRPRGLFPQKGRAADS